MTRRKRTGGVLSSPVLAADPLGFSEHEVHGSRAAVLRRNEGRAFGPRVTTK